VTVDFTREVLRTGAALVQAIKAGDADARLLLADLFEEYGMPNRLALAVGDATKQEAINELRRDLGPGGIVGDRGHYGVSVQQVSPLRGQPADAYAMYCYYLGPSRSVWVGTWLLWAWLGD
jgi:hypothetical protein